MKKIILLSLIPFLTTTPQTLAVDASQSPQVSASTTIAQDNVNKEMQLRKIALRMNVATAVATCKCFAMEIQKHTKLFPPKEMRIRKNANARAANLQNQPININSQADIFNFIADIKISTNKNYPPIFKIIDSWPSDKTSPEDLKQLDLKVSEALRALSSYCVQPYQVLGDQIYALSKGKIDLKTSTCEKPVF